MAKEDFAVGLLQGLYQGGVGNPQVNDQRRQNALQEAFMRQKMDAEAQENGMVRSKPVDPGTMNKILGEVSNVLFPGLGGQPMPSYEPDPNAPGAFVDERGEISDKPTPGAMRVTPRELKAQRLGLGKRNEMEEFQKAMALETKTNSDRKFKEDQISHAHDKLAGSQQLKDYLQTKKYAGNIEDAVKNPGAFGDLTLLYGYMRAIEPDSVVREGDQRLFQAAGSLSQRTANAMNNLATGQTLTQEQRDEVLKYTKFLKKNAFGSYETMRKGTYERAKRLNLPINEIDPLHDEVVDDTSSLGGTGGKAAMKWNPITGKVEPIR